MLVALLGTHEVKSNHESGLGRYDVMIIPKDHTQLGLIIEFKKALKKQSLDDAANDALAQIEARKYETELRARGIKDVLKLGIAFKGKEVMIKQGGRSD